MDKKDFFSEKTSTELDQRVFARVEPLLDARKREERRQSFLWILSAGAGVAALLAVWFKSRSSRQGLEPAILATIELEESGIWTVEDSDQALLATIDLENLNDLEMLEKMGDEDGV